MENDFEPLEPNVKGYSVTIDEQLYKRLEKHITVLKHIEQKGLTKQKWIMDAIKAKLNKDNQSDNFEIPKNRYLVLKINAPINSKIESNVSVQKRFRSYSKKQWILEAISEKLNHEEYVTKKFFDQINAEATPSSKPQG